MHRGIPYRVWSLRFWKSANAVESVDFSLRYHINDQYLPDYTRKI